MLEKIKTIFFKHWFFLKGGSHRLLNVKSKAKSGDTRGQMKGAIKMPSMKTDQRPAGVK